jgi:hypothetical protein
VSYFLVNQTAENGYNIGDIVQINPGIAATSASDNRGISSVITTSTITIRFGSNTNTFAHIRADTGLEASRTNANWKLRVIVNV